MQRKSIFRLMLIPIFFLLLGLFQMGTVQEATEAQPSSSSAQIQTPIRAIMDYAGMPQSD
jgi:hypothetical protein